MNLLPNTAMRAQVISLEAPVPQPQTMKLDDVVNSIMADATRSSGLALEIQNANQRVLQMGNLLQQLSAKLKEMEGRLAGKQVVIDEMQNRINSLAICPKCGAQLTTTQAVDKPAEQPPAQPAPQAPPAQAPPAPAPEAPPKNGRKA